MPSRKLDSRHARIFRCDTPFFFRTVLKAAHALCSPSKHQSQYDKEVASKALLKGAKKAQMRSKEEAAQAKAAEKAQARERARDAARAAGAGSSSEGQEMSSGTNTGNTTIL